VKLSAAALLLAVCLHADDALPRAASDALDKRFPGWSLAPVAPQITAWFEQDRIPGRPNLVGGDFDRDGREDLAAQILAGGRQRVVILVARGAGFEVHNAAEEEPDVFSFLVLFRRGGKDFDFEKMKPFRYASDCLGVLHSRKTADTLCWLGKGFQKRRSPGDEEAEAEREGANRD
jgi:hypothetical protein